MNRNMLTLSLKQMSTAYGVHPSPELDISHSYITFAQTVRCKVKKFKFG